MVYEIDCAKLREENKESTKDFILVNLPEGTSEIQFKNDILQYSSIKGNTQKSYWLLTSHTIERIKALGK